MVILAVIISNLLFVGLFFLCDDWREIINWIKEDWKASTITGICFIAFLIYAFSELTKALEAMR